MEIEFTQDIYYSNKKKIPIADVAKALLALEKVSSLAPILLENLFDDVNVKNMSIYVDELESGSLKEKIQYYLWVAFQKNLSENSGVEYNNIENKSDSNKSNIVGWVIAASLVVALKYAADKAFPNQEKPYIQQQINITVQAGRDITGMDTDELLEKIEAVVKENPEAIKGAVEFTKPAKNESDAYLKFGEDVNFSPEFLKEVPNSLLIEDEQERVIELNATEVFIRATDKDSGKKGWGATVPEFNEKRIRMHIAPGIDLVFLFHQDVVIGDVAIFYLIDSEGNIRKPHIHLYAVDKEATLLRNGKH